MARTGNFPEHHPSGRRRHAPRPAVLRAAAVPLYAALACALLLATGCQRAAPPRLTAEAVHFGPGSVAVRLPVGFAAEAVLLADGAGNPLLTQPVPATRPLTVTFGYDWQPGESLRIRRSDAPGGASAALAVEAPAARPPAISAVLQLPTGLDATGSAPLLLPAGARGSLALRLTRHADGPGAVRVRLHLPPALRVLATEPAGPAPARSPDGDSVVARTLDLPFRDESATLAVRFTVAPTAAGATDALRWTITPTGDAASHGQRPLRVLAPAALAAGLRLVESRFPADPDGNALPDRPAERVLLPPSGLAGRLSRWLAPAPERDRFQPGAYVRVVLANDLPGAVQATLRADVRDPATGKPAPAFAHPLRRTTADPATTEGASVGLLDVPAGGRRVAALPVYWNEHDLAPRRLERCTALYLWGLERPVARRCTPLMVEASPVARWVGLWALMAASVAVFVAVLWRLPRWVGRFATRDLVLVALTFGLAFLLVSLPYVAVGALTALALGPFQFLVEGLFYKLLLFALLGTLFALVRQPGVYALFYGLWMVAQGVLSGHYTPLVVLFAGISIALIETALWASGLTRRTGSAAEAQSWLLPAAAVGAAEGLAIFLDLHLLQALYRQYLADWYVVAQAAVQGAYAAAGLALGLRLGDRLRRVRRPPLREPVALATASPPAGWAPIPDAPLLEARGLGFRFPDAAEPALADISLTLAPGEVLLLSGASGSGKTTLLRLLQGLLPLPPGARLCWRGRDVATLPPDAWAGRSALLFQEPAVQTTRPIARAEVELSLALLPRNRRPPEPEAAVAEALARFRLEALADRPLETLSGGEVQRVALASLWVTRPEVLLLDEPLAQQDEAGRTRLLADIRALAATGTAVVIAEHRTAAVAHIADRTLHLAEGRLVSVPATDLQPEPVPQRPNPAPLPTTTGPRLTLAGVGFAHDRSAPLLAGLDAALPPGRAVALTGPNGAGKSTLLALLLGLHRPHAGAVVLHRPGHPPVAPHRLSWRARARCYGYLPQRADLLLHAPTAAAELMAALDARPRSEARARADEWLARLGLAHAGGRFPHLLSKGERERLALGTVLIREPDVLLLDEPFAGQDAGHVARVVALLEAWRAADPARCLLLVTHEAPPARLCDEVWHLAAGHLHAGTAPERTTVAWPMPDTVAGVTPLPAPGLAGGGSP